MDFIKAIFNALAPHQPSSLEQEKAPSPIGHYEEVGEGENGKLFPYNGNFALPEASQRDPNELSRAAAFNSVINSTTDEDMAYTIELAYNRASKEHKEHGQLWYPTVKDVATKMAERFLPHDPLGPQRVIGLIAAYSPRVNWVQNLKKVDNFLNQYAQGIRGNELSVPGLENANKAARRVIEAPSFIQLKHSLGGGKKVNAFFRNILGERHENPDRQPVTIDTHALAIALGWPEATPNGLAPSTSLYNRVAKAYTMASQRLGVPVEELQAATWVARRDRLTKPETSAKEARAVESIYHQWLGNKHPFIGFSRQKYTSPLIAHARAFSKGFENWILDGEKDRFSVPYDPVVRREKLAELFMRGASTPLEEYILNSINERFVKSLSMNLPPKVVKGIAITQEEQDIFFETEMKPILFFKAANDFIASQEGQLVDQLPTNEDKAYLKNLLSSHYALISPEKHDVESMANNDREQLRLQDVANGNAHKAFIETLNEIDEKYGPNTITAIPVEGSFGHVPELSYLVEKVSPEAFNEFKDKLSNRLGYAIINRSMEPFSFDKEMTNVAKKFNQESLIIGKEGNHKYINIDYSDLAKHLIAGTGKRLKIFNKKPETDYTAVILPSGKKIYFSLDFSWG